MPLNGDVPIHFETSGSGKPLLLIHAISAGSRMWQTQVDHFSPTHQVITFDARGVGRSGPIGKVCGVKDAMTDDVADLLDTLGLASATIVGVSFGGVIAQHFAARHPQRVDGLVIVDSYSDSRPRTWSKAAWLAGVYAGSLSNFAPKSVLRRAIHQVYRRWPEADAVLGAAMEELRPWQAFVTRNAINHVHYLDALNAGDYPLLAVVGEDSWWRAVPFMQEFADAVPRAELVRVPDSYDPTPLCQPEVFNTVLGDFLARHTL